MTSLTKEVSKIRLYNTLSRVVEPLQPLKAGEVSMYTCGPTVYNDQHIGNYRTFIFEDVLVRFLQQSGLTVKRVMNITDVGHLVGDGDEGEDKLQVGARREGTTAWDVAKRYEQHFLDDLKALHIENPTQLVRATDTIAEQIAFIQALEKEHYTYVTSDGVYFDSTKVPDYGKLARLDVQGLQAGARVEVGDKHHPTDFALWKFSPTDAKRDMEWQSPWGVGFPGWHIECSAIIQTALGPEIDIHCGGVDHIPVHHTNEIAQSESVNHAPLAKMWMHCEFLLIDNGKMAKSLGNVYTIADLRAKGISPEAYRLFTYNAHYRSKLNFTWDAAESAEKSLRKLERAYLQTDKVGELPQEWADRFMAELSDDLNTPKALAVMWEAVSQLPSPELRAFLDYVDAIFQLGLTCLQTAVTPKEIQALVDERDAARQSKNWFESDRLRDQLNTLGYSVQDTPDGTKVSLL